MNDYYMKDFAKDMLIGDLNGFKEYALSRNPDLEKGYREKQKEECKSGCKCCCCCMIILAIILLILYYNTVYDEQNSTTQIKKKY